MDPKQQVNKLDPKLQEAYNRVMGTSATPNATTPSINPVIPPSTIPTQSGQAVGTMPTSAPNQPLMHVEEVKPHPTMPGMPPTMVHPTTPTQPMMGTPMNPAMPPVGPHPISPTMTTPMQAGPTPPTPTGLPQQSFSMQPNMHPVPPQMPMAAPGTPVAPGTQPAIDPLHATVAAMPGGHISPQTHGFVSPKKKSKVSPVLLIVGALVFLVAYTVFWVKFFNVPIPFLTQ